MYDRPWALSTARVSAFAGSGFAIRYAYEYRSDSDQWCRAYDNENWEFGGDGPVIERCASISEMPIVPEEKTLLWPLRRWPDRHTRLSELCL